jgi:glycerophosphoryl diester phosphodiesterase
MTRSDTGRRPHWGACISKINATLVLAFALTACSEENWCESGSAEKLRTRIESELFYTTVQELLGVSDDDPVAIFAHRGGYHCEEMDGAPENSLPNLEKAIRMGFDGYETDMRMTSDGEFVIHHDETLDRTTTGTGDISSITFEESRELRLKYPSGTVSAERIPTLRELLAVGRGRILFLIEVKGGAQEHFPELLKIAYETGSIEHVLFWIDWTPEYATLYEQLLNSGVQEVRTNVMWRTRDMEALDDVVNKLDPIMVDIPPMQEELDKETGYTSYLLGILPKQHLSLVRAANEHGVKVMVSKVTTNSYIRGLRSEGVRVFMSRAPEVQLHYLIRKKWHR